MSDDDEIPNFFNELQKFNKDYLDFRIPDYADWTLTKKYINEVYHSKFIISDSGTAQEEPSILGTPVIVPRDFTERPESVDSNCSFMLDVNSANSTWIDSQIWLKNEAEKRDVTWLGDGNTADKIIEILKRDL